ncbi:MAG TPA: peroxiredoxin [Candidatus Binataceae bacterium]|nr:peroxiredoxin [Candidatus Binataceae bacterium]
MRLIIMAAIVLAVAGLGAIGFRPRIARAAMLPVGAPAPDFHSQMVSGDQVAPVSLADFHGRKLVLYFYPKDNTPGCTKEACAFRDGYARLQAWGIAVLGCSIDSADSHKAFIKKYRLPFPLLLDPDHSIARAYGADNGIPILGLDRRVTYVIGEDGHILKVYLSVDPGIHAKQIVHDLGADRPPSPPPTASPAASARTPSGAKGSRQAPRKAATPEPDEGSKVE